MLILPCVYRSQLMVSPSYPTRLRSWLHAELAKPERQSLVSYTRPVRAVRNCQ